MGELIIDVPLVPNVVEIRNCLMGRYEMTEREADEIIRYTVQDTVNQSKEWKVKNGYITLRYHNLSRFSLEDNTSGKKVVKRRPLGYSSTRLTTAREGITMPPAKGRRATAPAPEPVNGEVDLPAYLEKNLSATMQDYATWFRANVGDPDSVDSDRLLALGSTLYPYFQKSDFNIAQREARRAARTAEAEPEPAAPARGRGGKGRTAAAAAPAPGPGRGRGGRARAAAGRAPEEAY